MIMLLFSLLTLAATTAKTYSPREEEHADLCILFIRVIQSTCNINGCDCSVDC